MDDLKPIIESLLFVSDEPLSVERIKTAVGFAETPEIRLALQAISDEYEARAGGFVLRMVAGGYQIRTRPEYKEYIKRLVRSKPPRLSRAALETLAIVAYYKPITRTDIEHIRGVDCGGVLRMLLERKLIRVLGRKEIPGRPMIYETTKRFLEVFDLKDIRDLPSINEIEALEADASDAFESDSAAVGAEAPNDTHGKIDAPDETPKGSDAGPAGVSVLDQAPPLEKGPPDTDTGHEPVNNRVNLLPSEGKPTSGRSGE